MTALWLESSSTRGETDMRKKTDTWMELCELAAKEQNPQKLMELTGEIIRLLDETKRRPSTNLDTTAAVGAAGGHNDDGIRLEKALSSSCAGD